MQQKRSFIQSIKDCWYLAKPYWASEDKYKAIGLVSVVITLNLLSVYVSVLFNKWNNKFYDANRSKLEWQVHMDHVEGQFRFF